MSLAFYLTVGFGAFLILSVAAFAGIQGLRIIAQNEEQRH